MNNSFRNSIFIFLIIGIFSCFCNNSPQNILQEKTRIALVNPNVRYLASFLNLIDKKTIDIPNLELSVVAYSKDNKDHHNIGDFLKNNKYPFIVPRF